MSKSPDIILMDEEHRAVRVFHSANTKGRVEQKLAATLKSVDVNVDDEFIDMPAFEKFTKRSRR